MRAHETGDVTFSATNVKVPVSSTLVMPTSGSKRFVPAFSVVEKNTSVYALNVNNSLTSYSGTYDPGSIFISNLRKIYPFEAYMTTSSASAARSIGLEFDDGATGIDEIPADLHSETMIEVFTVGGIRVAKVSRETFDALWESLPSGIYVVNRKKMVK